MKLDKEAILESTISCPECGYKKEETMPTNACQYFYECENCKKVLKPTKNNCCVYCSYGTVLSTHSVRSELLLLKLDKKGNAIYEKNIINRAFSKI